MRRIESSATRRGEPNAGDAPAPRHAAARDAVRRRRVAARAMLALTAALLLGAPRGALAHARLVKAKPAEAQVLDASPGAIELWFNEILDDEFNGIELFPAADEESATANLIAVKPTVDAKDRTHLRVAVPPLVPGAYVVHWKVLSRDGHSARGRLSFRVGGAAAGGAGSPGAAQDAGR